MQLPPEDIDGIAALADEATRAVVDASERGGARRFGESNPTILHQVLGQLIETLRRIESDPSPEEPFLYRSWGMDQDKTWPSSGSMG